MDELVQFLVEELAFSGPLGISEKQLTGLIGEYYEQHAELQQNVDAALVHHIFDSLLALEEVHLGTVDLAKGALASPNLEDEGRTLTPRELIQKLGTDVHIAVADDTCWLSLTGSHAKPTKLTTKVYTALQLVAQGRGQGATTVEIGQHLGCDQKSAYHYVKSLVELDLVVKIKTVDKGSLTSRIVHKRYLSRSKIWADHTAKDPAAAELDGDQAPATPVHPSGEPTHQTQIEPPAAAEGSGVGNNGDAPADEDGDAPIPTDALDFSPIGYAHLCTNVPLVRSRILKVLSRCPLYAIPTAQLILSINLHPVNKFIRRNLNRIAHGLQDDHKIQHIVMTPDYNDVHAGRLHCWQLTQEALEELNLAEKKAKREEEEEGSDGQAHADHETLTHWDVFDPPWVPDEEERLNRLLYTSTITRQVIDLVFGSAENGLIQKELVGALRPTESRTIDQTLHHYETGAMASHLSDFGMQFVKETFGREQRIRYFSIAGYVQRCLQDEVDVPQEVVDRVDEQRAGSWALNVDGEDGNFASGKDLDAYIASLPVRTHLPMKKGEPGRRTTAQPIKLGRPKKDPNAPKAQYKRKVNADGTLVKPHPGMSNDKPWDPTQTKSFGKPQKRKHAVTVLDSADISDQPLSKPGAAGGPAKRRGRPPKKREATAQASVALADETPTTASSKRRKTEASATDAAETPSLIDAGAGVKLEALHVPPLPLVQQTVVTVNKAAKVGIDDPPENAPASSAAVVSQDDVDQARLKVHKNPQQDQVKQTNIRSTNHTLKKRENELFELLKDVGGVLEDTYALTREHQAWLRRSLNLDSSASVPSCDRRTLTQAVNNLEHRGEVKKLVVEVTGRSGVPRQVRLIHLPHLTTSSPEMVKFLNTLKTAPTIDMRHRYVEGDAASAVAAAFRWSHKRSLPEVDGVDERAPKRLRLSDRYSKTKDKKEKIKAEREERRRQKAAEQLAMKAQKMVARKERDWKTALDRFRKENRIDEIQEDVTLVNIKRTFMSTGGMRPEDFESEMHALLQRQMEREAALQGVHLSRPPFSSFARHRPAKVIRVPQAQVAALPGVSPAPATAITRESGGPRKRIKWTIEEDDLLRDFWVVMTVRAEVLNKCLPWKEAHEKLIPNHAANQCRNHFMRSINRPETQAYLNALVQSWKEVWAARRGFGALAEFDDRSMTGIDIRAQVQELRHTVHASVAHLGGLGLMPRNLSLVNLPNDPMLLEMEQSVSIPNVWTDGLERWAPDSVAIAGRAKELDLLSSSFGANASPRIASHASVSWKLAAAVIKSMTATPQESYEIERGSALLSRFSETVLTEAIHALQKSGTIIKIDSRASRRLPGRNYMFSDKFDLSLRKQLSSATWKDAAATANSLQHQHSDSEQTLSLVPENGEMLALLDFVSKGHVELSLDLSLNEAKRDISDYQTRKLDDECLENGVVISTTAVAQHLGPSLKDVVAACHERIGLPCLSEDQLQSSATKLVVEVMQHSPSGDITQQQVRLELDQLLEVARASPEGLQAIHLDQISSRPGLLAQLVSRGLTSQGDRPQLLAWVGFEEPRLTVCTSEALNLWTADVPSGAPDVSHNPASTEAGTSMRFIPCVWIDVNGNIIEAQLEKISQAVLALLHMKPGLTEVEVHRKMQPVLDQTEVWCVLEMLEAAGFVERMFSNEKVGHVSRWTSACWRIKIHVCWYLL